ncbi:5-formyltetrahydrofolate cyclo-ligase [Metabacillus herbersteinensis]|uniref:5-formyltetrahydrofolate cyclo-ligase n=1 Tax=Metabacillus herbersteinensis TaxID=283816 RepID=A0ABV6G8K6_9BACI
MINKKSMRVHTLKKLQQLSDATFETGSATIHKQLYSEDVWNNASTIGLTISNGHEVDTKSVIEKAWMLGKRVVVPKCDPSRKTMNFREIKTFDELEIVYYSLREPIIELTDEVSSEEIDLIIVPGVVFDKRGYRIGYGGGYYDRYLSSYSGNKLSMAFSLQIEQDNLPTEEHDVAVSKLITEQEILNCTHG